MAGWQSIEVAPKDCPVDIMAKPTAEAPGGQGVILPRVSWVKATDPSSVHPYGSYLAPRSFAGHWPGMPQDHVAIAWRYPAHDGDGLPL